MILYILLFVLMAVSCRNRMALLFLIMFGSCIVAGLSIGYEFYVDTSEVWIYIVISLILYPYYLLFNSLDIGRSEIVLDRKKLRIMNGVVLLAGIGTVISIFALLVMLRQYGMSGLDINQFKNGGYSRDFASSNLAFVNYNILLSPLGYLSLGIHFVYVIRRDLIRSSLALFGAASLLITPLLHLARGGVLLFFLLYVFYFVLVYPCLDRDIRRKIVVGMTVLIVVISSIFMAITINRFEDFAVEGQGFVSNPLVYSLFSYMSQWMVNGVEIIKVYTSDQIVFASNFMYLPNRIMQFFGAEAIDFFLLKIEMFGDYGTSFNGMPALLIYDFGVFGAVAFSWSYYFLVRRLYRKKDDLVKLLAYAFVVPVSVYFFQGVYFVFGSFNIALVYLLLFGLFSRVVVGRRV